MEGLNPTFEAALRFCAQMRDVEEVRALLRLVLLTRRGGAARREAWTRFDERLLTSGLDRGDSSALLSLDMLLHARAQVLDATALKSVSAG